MKKNSSQKNTAKNKILALLFSLAFLPWPYVFAQENTPPAPTQEPLINYNTDLVEVTDTGVYDAQGNILDPNQLSVLKAPVLKADQFSLSSTPSSEKKSEERETSQTSSDHFSNYQASLLQNWSSQTQFATNQLNSVQQDMQHQEKRFEELRTLIEKTENDLEPLGKEIQSLENQLNLYNGQIEQLKGKTRTVENLIAEKRISLRELMLELDEINTRFKVSQQMATDFISLLHEQTGQFEQSSANGEEALKQLLSDQTLAEQSIETSYLETMESAGRKVFNQLQDDIEEAHLKQKQIEQEEEELHYLLETLTQQRQNLEQVRLSKTQLLEETQGKQEEYQKLLEDAKKEREEIEYELANMEDVNTLLRQQLAVLKQGLSQVQNAQSPGDLANFSQVPNLNLKAKKTSSKNPFQVDAKLLELLEADLKAGVTQLGLSWPVKPNKITAMFSDANYIKTFGVAHGANDIRSPQGSPVYAAADGMVVKVGPANSTAYAYVSIASGNGSKPPGYTGTANGLVTVYGHMSQIDVKVGQIVERGQVIGLSGGMPGTIGAGRMTTGAHMHFEVWENGSRTDPLEFLRLEGVNDDYLPAGWKSYERDRKYWEAGK